MFTRTVFPNGIRCITVPMPESPAVTVLILVAAGSSYETKEENGIAHFLEHMCFKGTRRRPKAIDIAHELDALGAQYNAFTSREYTGYYAKVDHRHAPVALDVVSDIYLNSLFPENEIEKEKNVIVEEINMYEDMPQYRVHDLYASLLYGDQPAGWNIAGRKETVRSFTRDQLVHFHEKHYTSGATAIIVSGRFEEKRMIRDMEKVFSVLPQKGSAQKRPTIVSQEGLRVATKEREGDQTHVVVGVRTFDVFDKRNAALSVLTTILGGGMSSRLFSKLRNDLGICYYVSADTDDYTDRGSLDISVGADIARVPQALGAIMGELTSVKNNPVSPRELQKAKDFAVGSLSLSLETSSSLATFFGAQEIIGKTLETPDEIARKINAVTAEDVANVAHDIVVTQGLNCAVVGPRVVESDVAKALSL